MQSLYKIYYFNIYILIIYIIKYIDIYYNYYQNKEYSKSIYLYCKIAIYPYNNQIVIYK